MADDRIGSGGRRDEVSTARLYLMRALYLLNVALVGSNVWPHLIDQSRSLPLMDGVAYSFYIALSTLSVLGLRCPLKMVPLLLLQLSYKVAWLLAVALPLSAAGALHADFAGAVQPFLVGAALDIVIIPWPYVVAHYLRTPGDRWKSFSSRAR